MKSGRELKLSTCEKDEKVNIKIIKDPRDLRFFSFSTCVSLSKSCTPQHRGISAPVKNSKLEAVYG